MLSAAANGGGGNSKSGNSINSTGGGGGGWIGGGSAHGDFISYGTAAAGQAKQSMAFSNNNILEAKTGQQQSCEGVEAGGAKDA